MPTFVNTLEWPTFGKWYDYNGQSLWLVDRHFPRLNRMVCTMQDLDGITQTLVFPYTWA